MRILMIGPRLDVKGGVSELCNMMIEENHQDCEIIFRPSMNDKSLLGRIYHFFARIALFPGERLFLRPDLVHIHFSHSLSTWRKYVISALWRISGVPVIMHAHSSDYREYLPSLPWPLRGIAIRSIRKSNALVVLSESWKDFYTDSCNLMDDEIYQMETPIAISDNALELEKTVLFSGRIGDRKGAIRLIQAWSKIDKEERIGWRLLLTGDGEVRRAKDEIIALSVSNSVSVLGWVDEDTICNLMERTSIFALPSRNEGLPMSLLRAMSTGTAVITSPVGGIPEIVKDGNNGILVDPDDVGQISERLSILMNNQELRKKLSKNAIKTTESLDIRLYMPKMAKIWREVIELS